MNRMAQVVEYESGDRWQKFQNVSKLKILICGILVGLTTLFAVANFRILHAHHTLMVRINAGQVDCNGATSSLGRLDYLKSIRPLLWKPWRDYFVLYYRNGYVVNGATRSYAKVP